MNTSGTSTNPVPPSQSVLRNYPLLFFFLMAYGFAWIAWIPYLISIWGVLPLNPLTGLTFSVGTFLGPTLAAFIMTGVTEGKAGIGHLLHRYIQRRAGFKWHLFVLLGIPALVLLGIIVLPGAPVSFQAPTPLFLVSYLEEFAFILFLGGPLAEEPGWRGFALPRLQRRSGPLVGTLILGVLWGLWHLPLFLVHPVYNRAVIAFILLPLGAFVLSTMAIAIIFTWVFNHTQGSLLPVMLLHASNNAAGNTFGMLFPYFKPASTLKFLSLLIVYTVVALLIVVATRGRLGYQYSQRREKALDSIPSSKEPVVHDKRR
jgi:membrane protease YdiL (CAAX protease family)